MPKNMEDKYLLEHKTISLLSVTLIKDEHENDHNYVSIFITLSY